MAIPLSMAANFATVYLQRYLDRRPQRSRAFRLERLRRRVATAEDKVARYRTEVAYGLASLIDCLVWVGFAILCTAVGVFVGTLSLADDPVRTAMICLSMAMTFVISTWVWLKSIRIYDAMSDMSHLEARRRELAELEGEAGATALPGAEAVSPSEVPA